MTPSAFILVSRFRASVCGGPNSFSVPAISRTHRNAPPSLRSSTRGEKHPAHSSKTAFADASSCCDRSNAVTEGNVSTSTFVMPCTIPKLRAFTLSDATCCRGGSPSITTHGWPCNSLLRRSKACAGNSRTRTAAYSSGVLFIALPPRWTDCAIALRSLAEVAFLTELHLRKPEQNDGAPLQDDDRFL